YLHENQVEAFFRQGLNGITNLHNRKEREICLSYLCGFFCHYKFDHLAHPYIYGRTNFHVLSSDHSYYHRHFTLEHEIDRQLLREYSGENLTEFNQSQTFRLSKKEKDVLSHFMAGTLKRTLGSLHPRNHIYFQPWFFRFLLVEGYLENRFLLDPYGHKKKIVQKLENCFFSYPLLSSKFVTDQCEKLDDIMNTRHEIWVNPWDKRIQSTESFYDLYRKSCRECTQILNHMDVNKLFSKEIHISKKHREEILERLGDFSYHSGL
ncbi:MAG TPA: hypothetical protein IAC41_10440, partial [Candidatus Merdenecus merdavium]|nr:hypothetical protein [Candidatus Merdenecus merdavium]